jgi:hypothetical protein
MKTHIQYSISISIGVIKVFNIADDFCTIDEFFRRHCEY